MKPLFPLALLAALCLTVTSCCLNKKQCAIPVPESTLSFQGFANDEIDTVWVYELVPGTGNIQDSMFVSGISFSNYFELGGESDLRITVPATQRSYFINAYTFECRECKNCATDKNPERTCYVNGYDQDAVRKEGRDIVIVK